jgi:superfamily I DNA/RNA helicase
MLEVVYLNKSEFRDRMLALQKRGGPHQQAYRKACSIIESLRLGADVSNFITNHGESRIAHCIKYDLGHACRLLTVHSEGFIYLLYVGTHDDADQWATRNAGLTVTVNKDTKQVVVTHITKREEGEHRPLPHAPEDKFTEANVPYFKRIPNFSLSEFVPQQFLAAQLLKIDEASSDEDIQSLFGFIEEQDSKLASFLFDVIAELREGNIEGAEARVEAERGKAVPVSEAAQLEKDAVKDETNAERLANLTGMTKEEVERLFTPDRFREWMLFLHPEQKRIAESDFDKPAVLTGVSGSGKTVVLVHRARYLARKYPGERIGVLTLSRSLARLIENQLKDLCTESEFTQIRVHAFYDYLKIVIDEVGPEKYLGQLRMAAEKHPYKSEILSTIDNVRRDTFAREYDPLSGEDLDETWNIFLDQPPVQTQYGYFREHVEKYQWNIDAEAYLLEEFSLVRSAFATSMRNQEYLEYSRVGRAIRFLEDDRERVLNLLLLFEETMLHGGMLDVLSLTAAVLPHRKDLSSLPAEKRFRCLLIDEYQDLSTLDLQLLRRIPTKLEENGLFLTGDPVQRVLVKDLRMKAVGLDPVSAKRVSIKKNYRNSRQILGAAIKLAEKYGEQARAQGEDIEVLDPELAVRETAPPIALNAADQIAAAWRVVTDCLVMEQAVAWSVCICTANPKAVSVKDIIQQKPDNLGIDAKPLTGDYTEDRNTVTVGGMSDLKGFEFSLVVVVGCSKDELPHLGRCKDEDWREALRLYVAMTRARDSVYLVYSGVPSVFLTAMTKEIEWQTEEVAA